MSDDFELEMEPTSSVTFDRLDRASQNRASMCVYKAYTFILNERWFG